MIRFMYVPNMKKFAQALEECHGSVLLHLSDDTTCNLKSNTAAMQMLKIMPSGYTNLCVSFSDSHDSTAFMRYMINAAHD